MKKILKRVGVLLLLATMVFSLCGCRELDEMRERQLFLEEDGSFFKDGIRYVPLDANDYFCPNFGSDNICYLTKPDVPVLLSQQFNIGYLEFSEDGSFCEDLQEAQWYCREDLFEEVQAKNREPFVPDILFYNYFTYDENGEWKDLVYTLSQDEADAIAKVLKGEPLQLGDGIYITYDWELTLTEATEDLLFSYSGPTLGKAGNTLYITIYSGKGTHTYQVPQEYNSILETMAKRYLDAYYDDMFIG